MTGTELITAERERQMTVKGWAPEHDALHTSSELAQAGASYALEASACGGRIFWPWTVNGALEGWNPGTDPVRSLVKAGALIAAEMDRLQRKAEQGARHAP
jgi:hypothetical protein